MRSNGFTLIELLIVIAIIGLLASVVIVSFPGAMKSVRDGIRKHDLDAIRKGLEQYWDVYGHYPSEALYCDSSIGGSGTACPINPPQDYWAANSDIQDLVAEGYLGIIPIDPINDATYYYYYEPDSMGVGGCQVNTCQWYLRARLEIGGWYYVRSVRNAQTHPKGGP